MKSTLLLVAALCGMLVGLSASAQTNQSKITSWSFGGPFGFFSVHGKVAHRYVFEESADLISWHPITDTNAPIVAEHDDFNVAVHVNQGSQGFYRFIELPPGLLTVSVDSQNPLFSVITGGATNVVVNVFDLRAGNASISVDKIGLILGSSFTTAHSNILRVTASVGSILLGECVFTATDVGTVLTLASPITIESNSVLPIVVRVDFAGIGPGLPGHSADLHIDVEPSLTHGSVVGSGESVTALGYAGGAGFLFVRSYPIVTKIPLPVPGFETDNKGLLLFSVTANSSGSIGLGKMSVAVNGFGIGDVALSISAFTDPQLTDPISGFGQDGLLAPYQVVSPYSETNNYAEVYPQMTNGVRKILEIPAGTTYYFKVNGGFGNKDAAAITVSLMTEEGGDIVKTFDDIDAFPFNFFIWTPNSTGGATDYSDPDWFNSFAVPGLFPDGINQTRTP